MINLTYNGQIFLKYAQKVTTHNAKYNSKEVTVPSEVYHLWEQQVGVAVNEVTLVTIRSEDSILEGTFIVLKDQVTNADVVKLCNISNISHKCTFKQETLRIRINKSRPNKEGKRKQKATMTINKSVTIMSDEAVFIVDPNRRCLSGQYGLCSVEGLLIGQQQEKKVSKEKKTSSAGQENTSTIPYVKVNEEYLQKQSENRKKRKKKAEECNQYIKGNKKNGYYIVNEDKGIITGAFCNKNDVKDAVLVLMNEDWSQEAIDVARLNIEYYIAEEGYPYIKNTGVYYCLSEEDFAKIEQDANDNTPFKNISYDKLQKIIQESIQYED